VGGVPWSKDGSCQKKEDGHLLESRFGWMNTAINHVHPGHLFVLTVALWIDGRGRWSDWSISEHLKDGHITWMIQMIHECFLRLQCFGTIVWIVHIGNQRKPSRIFCLTMVKCPMVVASENWFLLWLYKLLCFLVWRQSHGRMKSWLIAYSNRRGAAVPACPRLVSAKCRFNEVQWLKTSVI
jgi:hypothetical protein